MRCRVSGRHINVCPELFSSKQIAPLSSFALTPTIGAYSSRGWAQSGRFTRRVWASIIASWLIVKTTIYIGIGLALTPSMTGCSATSRAVFVSIDLLDPAFGGIRILG